MVTWETAVRLGEENGVRLEVVGDLTTWEIHPSFRHQRHSFRLQSSIRPTPGIETACECVHAADVYIRSPDGSLKRPDIAIFCSEPEEQTEAITQLPQAVIEIISPGYEGKDLSLGIPFYLRMGIKDMIVFDPETGTIRHFRPGHSEVQHQTPTMLQLACGCQVTV